MRHTRGILPHALALATAFTAAGVARPAAAADQLVAFDEVFTIVQKGDGGLEAYHHRIDPKPTEPASWVTPVNYSKGTAYLYVEVMKKPSARNTILTMCFDGERTGYGCIDTDSYTAVSSFTTMSPMAEGGKFWNYKAINWGTKRGQYHIVVKDPGLGGTPGGKPPTDFVPTTVRLALTVVPPGGTYVPPPAGMMPADAGTPAEDAGAPGTGGSGAGTGGAAAGSGGGPAGTGGSPPSGATGGSGSSASGGSSGAGTGGTPSGSTGGSGSSASGGSSGSSSGSGGSSGSSGSNGPSAPAASGCSLGPAAPGSSAPGGASLLLAGALAAILGRRAGRR